ncbi:MAG: hypothetical protein H6742_04195 [Alphaproteobacteria bacterium]|nr:hypothetical protein [Alphaproteobacteria bacterium]
MSGLVRHMLKSLALVPVLLLWCLPALATTVAVLPLSQGSGSEQYAGLGTALSGMLVSDLSQADGLTLVERERLGDLLGEIDLAEGGYVDPATAQKLGRGLGAQVVLTGSYSVVADTFLLDARLVRVESGEIVQAADSQGTVQEFVAVEKALVEQLLEGLEVALSMGAMRKIMLQAPTEQFGAFAAYGEGLHHQDRGELAEAAAAFERAVAADPEFEEARASLAALRNQLEAARQEQRLVADAFLDERFRKALATIPDERERPRDFRHDPDSMAGFMVRQQVLADAGLHCQRAEEMAAFLRHTGFDVQVPQASPVVGYRALMLAKELDLWSDEATKARVRLGISTRATDEGLFRGTTAFILDTRQTYAGRRGSGMIESVLSCRTEAEHQAAVQALIDDAKAAGQLERVDDERRPLSLHDHLDILWAWLHARQQGADSALTRRTEAMLGRHQGQDSKDMLLNRLDEILLQADQHGGFMAGTLGIPPDRLEAEIGAMASGDPARLKMDRPVCALILQNQGNSAKAWVARLAEARAEQDPDRRFTHERLQLQMGGFIVGPARDMGCIADVPARFPDLAALAAATENVKLLSDKQADSTCISMKGNLDTMRSQLHAGLANPAMPEPSRNAMAWGVLATWYGMITQRCTAIPERAR